MTVQDIFNFLNGKFPVDTACDFDNVGLLVGDKNSNVTKALIALDCTKITIDNAIENGCNLIVTHHPVIFAPLKTVLSESIVYKLIKNNISVISMHTNLDISINGVNDTLSQILSPKTCEKVIASDGFSLNKCEISTISADHLAKLLKEKLGGSIKYTLPNKQIESVLLCSGSGGSYINFAKLLNCDALITADVKHNQFLDSLHYDIALFDAGHFNTENIMIEPLKKLLINEFPTTEFICDHTNYIENR